MPNKNNSSRSIPSILESAVNSMKEHERELDILISRLEKVKENLSANVKKTNNHFDNIISRIEILDNEVPKT